MSWKMVRTVIVAILTAVLISLWLLWLRLGPSFTPDDVSLRAKLLPITSVPNAKPLNGETLAAEVTVKRDGKAAVPSADSAGDYLYVYAPGTQSTEVRINEEPQSSVLRPGAVSGLPNQAIAMLKEIGVSVTLADLTEHFWQYTGTSGSYTARFLLKPQQSANGVKSPDPQEPGYAIYIHEEHKWGRNVSWTKAVKLDSK